MTDSFQWERNPGSGYVDIGGATSPTYMLVADDVGATIRARGTRDAVLVGESNELGPILAAAAPTGKLWGISPSNNGGFNPAIATQLATYLDLGINCPRIPGDTATANAARAAGFTQWVAWLSGDGSATPAQAVTYAEAYPEAVIVGIGNELNLNGSWTAHQVATKQLALWDAMVAAGIEDRVGLSCIGNSPSSAEGLLPLDWCKRLASHGCVEGHGFTYADYHMYGGNPQSYDNWMHVWTPAGDGTSCQSVLGHPQFVITEMGAKIGRDVADAAAQAAAATAWVQKLASLPEALGGMWFQAYDGTVWAGYGLVDGAGVHRASYAAFKAAVAAAS